MCAHSTQFQYELVYIDFLLIYMNVKQEINDIIQSNKMFDNIWCIGFT